MKKQFLNLKALIAAAFLVAVSVNTSAAKLATENFNGYIPGTWPTVVNGGTGWALGSNWGVTGWPGGTSAIVANSLQATEFGITGAHLEINNSSTGRNFSAVLGTSATWISFKVKGIATGNNTWISFLNGANQNFSVNCQAGFWRVNGIGALVPTTPAYNTTAFHTVYLYLDPAAASGSKVKAWFSKTADPSATAAEAGDDLSPSTDVSFDNILLGTGGGGIAFDNLIVGTTWADVVQPAEGPSKVNAPAAQGLITIDGNTADWTNIPSVPMTVTEGTNANFVPKYKVSWDKKNLYMLAEIQDSAKVNKGDFWALDELELYLDMDNSKGTGFDGKNDMQIRIVRDSVIHSSGGNNNEAGSFPWLNSLEMPGMVYKTKEVTGGWLVELAIPLDSLQRKSATKIDFSNGGTIGFNADVVNTNKLAANNGKAWALNPTIASWDKMNTWGNLTMTGTPAVTTLVTPATQGVITIDADPADWAGIVSTPVAVVNYGAANLTGPNDFSGSFKTAWDKKNFYFYADIKDDIKIKKGTSYLVDNFELSLDVNHSKATAFDLKDDVKIRINRDTVLTSSGPGDNGRGDYPWTAATGQGMKGMVIMQKEVAGGWQVELSIPFDSIQSKNPTPVVVGENSKIGLQVYFCDQDSANATGPNRTKLLWLDAVGANPSTWGDMVLTGTPAVTELPTPAIQNKITIDADPADWAGIVSTPVAVVNYGAANLTGPNDFSGSFKTAWDKKNFYFYADIKDDIKIKKGTSYLVDNFELSLDVNHSKATAFDLKDDVKIRINRDTVLTSSGPGDNGRGDYPWTAATGQGMKGMVIMQKEVAGGWQVELSIPFDSIQSKNPSPVVVGQNSKIGLQVYFCDQDSANATGPNRTKLLWLNAVGANPSTWGDMVLTGTPADLGVKVSENFDEYTAGTWPTSNDGGTGWAAGSNWGTTGWPGGISTIATGNLTATGVATTGAHLEINNSSTGRTFSKMLGATKTWISFRVKGIAVGNNTWIQFQKGSAGTFSVNCQAKFWRVNGIGALNPTTPAYNTTDVQTVYLCVDTAAVTGSKVKAWFNKTADPSATVADASDNLAPTSTVLFDNILLGTGGGGIAFDNLIIGGSWDDVVQPATPNALKDVNANRYGIYPNPVNDMLFINNATDIQSVSVYAINGKLLNTYRNNTEMVLQVNTSKLNQGLYLLKITSADGSVEMSKFVKK
ncbi:MAG: sugar-binding protein [Paludibacter sp.]